MSKYAQLRARMGGMEDYNDKTKNGRVLKWYADTKGASPKERKDMAAVQAGKVADLPYVQKVLVRNARGSAYYGGIATSFDDCDKICIYIDPI